jgi:hypothetical protein
VTIVELHLVQTLGQCMFVWLRRAPVFFFDLNRLQLDGTEVERAAQDDACD